MINKKLIMISILILSLLAVSAVSAADNVTDDKVQSVDENGKILKEDVDSVGAFTDLANETDNLYLIKDEDYSILNALNDESGNSKLSTSPDDFILQQKINETPYGGLLVLDKDYNIDSYSIIIEKPITIDGTGHKLYIKEIPDDYFIRINANNVVLKNIVFRDIHSGKSVIGWFGNNGKLDSCSVLNNNIYGPTYYKGHIEEFFIYWAGNNGTITHSKLSNNKGDTLIYLIASNITIYSCDFNFNENLHSIWTSYNLKGCIIDNCSFKNCNSDKGIIYNNANSTLIKNCKFIENNGIVIYLHDYYNDYTVETRNRTSGYNSQIVGSIFVYNKGNIIVSNAKSCSITNSIILDSPDNEVKMIYLLRTDLFSANYNWWGNTLNNRFINPYYDSGVEVNHWLFLNDTCYIDYLKNSSDKNIKSSFYDCYIDENGDKTISKYFSSSLPNASLIEYECNNGTIDKFTIGEIGVPIYGKYSFDAHKIVITGTFSELNKVISSGFNVYLKRNYTFFEYTDHDLVDGIIVGSQRIYGNGFTIDGSHQARIFNVISYSIINDLNFINASSDRGAAIMGSGTKSFTVYYSNFTNNHASISGGAIYNGHAINCSFKNNTAEYGGAIYIGAADNCTFEDNSAYYAGAVYNVYAVNSTFFRNHADDSCGAMFNNSAVNCTFTGNYANNHSGAFGFGYALNSIFTGNHAIQAGAFGFGAADSCIFKYNYADEGGAMFAGDANESVFIENHAIRGGALLGNVQVSNCSFENNYATEYGGAIFESYAERCNFTGNHAKSGGAIYNGPDGTAHCIFTNNSADEYGGALYGTYANNCTFTLNSANFGGAISSHSSASNSAFVSNTARTSGSNKFDSYVFNCTYDGKLPKYTLYCPDFTAVEGFGTNINVKMYDSPGYFVDGEIITVNIYNENNTLVKTYGDAQTGYNIFINLPAGRYSLIASVKDNAYDINSINITGIIKKPTFIFAGNVNATYKDGKTLTVYLHGPDDEILTNKTISVAIAESAKNYTTDIKGQVIIPLDSLVPGNYSADISFAGDSMYVESSAQANVTINKLETKLTAEYDASSENIVATVKDLKGNPVRGLEVGFAIDGVKYVTTDAKGQARYSTKGLGDKVHNVKVMVYGNDIYNDSNQETVKVGNKTQTKIFLRNALYFVTQTKLVRVTLWDANNHPLSNKTVYIRAYDSIWHGITDENGDAYVRVGIGFGVHDATVGFDGDDDYNSSTRAGYIRVIKQTPSVMVRGADSQFKADDSNKIVKVHLRDRYNQPLITNSKIVFKLNGKTYIGFTDINGVASIEISISTVGTFTAQAMYGGNSAFNAVTRDIKIRIT